MKKILFPLSLFFNIVMLFVLYEYYNQEYLRRLIPLYEAEKLVISAAKYELQSEILNVEETLKNDMPLVFYGKNTGCAYFAHYNLTMGNGYLVCFNNKTGERIKAIL